MTNPVGISAAEDVLGPFADVAGTVFWVLPLAAVISVVVRFRAAQAVERAQIKWLAMAACLAVTAILAMFPLGLVIDTDHGLGDLLGAVLVCAAIASFPVAAGFAILRDRLYDIDVVVNRALVYGALTTTLVVTYLVLVLGLRTVLAPADRRFGPRSRRLDAGGGGAVPTAAVADPDGGRPPVLPAPVRRRPHTQSSSRPAFATGSTSTHWTPTCVGS